MRVFLPSTLPAVAKALLAGQVGPGVQRGFAVTPALREAYASGDAEELEYAALTEAARASLRPLAAVPAEHVKPDPRDGEPARVALSNPIKIDDLASAHVDAPDADADVRSAVQA